MSEKFSASNLDDAILRMKSAMEDIKFELSVALSRFNCAVEDAEEQVLLLKPSSIEGEL